VSEELYRIVCKRVAFDAFPKEASGMRFNAVCDGQADSTGVLAGAPRLQALVARRTEIISALAQMLADEKVAGGQTFAEGELKSFLTSLVPFYAEPQDYLPKSSRAIAAMLNELIKPVDETGKARDTSPAAARAVGVLEKLAAVSQRKGYRPANRALGAVRPLLSYPGLDELGQKLLGLVAKGGAGRDAFVGLLRAGTLELAEPAVAVPNREDTTLHVALNFVLGEDERFTEAGTSPVWVLRRDLNGNAQLKDGVDPAGQLPTPFPVPDQQDATARGPLDPAKESYTFFDASKTPLAAGMREAKSIVERPANGDRSTLELVSRGLRPLMGPTVDRSVQFAGKPYAFKGPDPRQGPLADLVHAVGAIASYEETADLLDLLTELLDKNENAAAAPVKMMMDVDALADDPRFDNAKLVGVDGTPNSPHEWWDDAIGVGIRALKREGLVTSLISSFISGEAAVQGQLYAGWMKHRDRVSPNFPMTGPDSTQGDLSSINGCEKPCYTPAEATTMSTQLTFTYQNLVERSQPDVGMNRSLWQRTMSMIHAFNGLPLCNKDGAFLSIHGVPAFAPFYLPVGGPQNNATFKACEVIELDDSTQIFAQAMLGTANVGLKDEITVLLAGVSSPLLGSTGDIQERESQIKGFRDKPTAQSLSRFIYAPRNKWVNDLFDPVKTREGKVLTEFEPGALYPTEIVDPNATADGVAHSFITAGKPLVKAFEEKELRDKDGKLTDGYMFGHLMEIFHRHWSSRKNNPCPIPAGDPLCAGQSEADCNTGCTQSLDPGTKGDFYSPQTNLVSYEPLLIEAFINNDFTGVLARAAADLKGMTVNGKDGLTILGKFTERMLRADSALRYRDGRAFAMTNTCVAAMGADGQPANPVCDCPTGATPTDVVDEATKQTTCKMPSGTIVRRGRIIEGGIPPIYMLLDALKSIDNAFAKSENTARLPDWRKARSRLVDQFLTSVADPANPGKTVMKNQRARTMGIVGSRFLAERIRAHRAAGDLQDWAKGLAGRFETTFGHPLVAGFLDLLDKVWDDPAAAAELAKVSTYLMDPSQADAFSGLMVAAADTVTFVDREPALTPIVQFAALGLAPNAFTALDNGTAPDVESGALSQGLELAKSVVDLDKNPGLSPIGRLLTNLVLPNAKNESPLEVIFDATADVNRLEPQKPTTVPLTAADDRKVFDRVQGFLLDEDRGIERLYKVIQNRKVKK
jgi:hypothetical protein